MTSDPYSMGRVSPGTPTSANGTTPPPLSNRTDPPDELFKDFNREYLPIEGPMTPFRVVDALLKTPAAVIHDVLEGKRHFIFAVLLGLTIISTFAYGIIMGTFSGGHQLWAVPVKLVTGVLLSAAICLPSLYIFGCLSGRDHSLWDTAGLLITSLALSAVLLVGFAPVIWLFSQSTNATFFMGAMHLLFWFVSLYFGLRLLMTAFLRTSVRGRGILKMWCLIFLLVVLQMSTTLRPLIGKYQGTRIQRKQFFLIHWGNH